MATCTPGPGCHRTFPQPLHDHAEVPLTPRHQLMVTLLHMPHIFQPEGRVPQPCLVTLLHLPEGIEPGLCVVKP